MQNFVDRFKVWAKALLSSLFLFVLLGCSIEVEKANTGFGFLIVLSFLLFAVLTSCRFAKVDSSTQNVAQFIVLGILFAPIFAAILSTAVLVTSKFSNEDAATSISQDSDPVSVEGTDPDDSISEWIRDSHP